MRPAAEIDELPLPVEGQRRVAGQAGFDVLGLQGLVQAADDLQRLLPRHLHPLEGLVGLDDPPHLGLDQRQILVGDRPARPHVVIEAMAHRGAEGELHAVEEPHHRPGHHVGRRVSHHGERAGVTGKERLDRGRALGRQRRVEPHDLPVEQSGDGGLLAPFSAGHGGVADAVGHLRGGGKVAGGAVGQADDRHGGNEKAEEAPAGFRRKTAGYPPSRSARKPRSSQASPPTRFA